MGQFYAWIQNPSGHNVCWRMPRNPTSWEETACPHSRHRRPDAISQHGHLHPSSFLLRVQFYEQLNLFIFYFLKNFPIQASMRIHVKNHPLGAYIANLKFLNKVAYILGVCILTCQGGKFHLSVFWWYTYCWMLNFPRKIKEWKFKPQTWTSGLSKKETREWFSIILYRRKSRLP